MAELDLAEDEGASVFSARKVRARLRADDGRAIPAFRATLAWGRERLVNLFHDGQSAESLVRARAHLVDEVLSQGWERHLAGASEGVALVAVGGYGRGELLPASDIDILILHDGAGLKPEKTWRHLDGAALGRAFQINATGPALAAKHFLPLLAEDSKSCFAALSARVGSTADNGFGGWYAYRASKAALNMLVKTLSIELARRNPAALCVTLHPGTVDTRLSAPFQRGVPDGKLFSPRFSAERLLGVLDGLSPEDSGGLFAWDGARIPF